MRKLHYNISFHAAAAHKKATPLYDFRDTFSMPLRILTNDAILPIDAPSLRAYIWYTLAFLAFAFHSRCKRLFAAAAAGTGRKCGQPPPPLHAGHQKAS